VTWNCPVFGGRGHPGQAQPGERGSRHGAISQFGFGGIGLTAADFSIDGRVIQLGLDPNRIDLLTTISGVTFDEAWAERASGRLDGVAVTYIGRACLVKNKEAPGRAKDRIDAEELRQKR
jgi:hypothetical protein